MGSLFSLLTLHQVPGVPLNPADGLTSATQAIDKDCGSMALKGVRKHFNHLSLNL